MYLGAPYMKKIEISDNLYELLFIGTNNYMEKYGEELTINRCLERIVYTMGKYETYLEKNNLLDEALKEGKK